MRNETACNYRTNMDKSFSLEHFPLGIAYVPWQEWQSIFDAEKAFHHGTIFQELYKPFIGKGGCRS